jgi:membrane-associated protease RseP (regulator of RpoE activity)
MLPVTVFILLADGGMLSDGLLFWLLLLLSFVVFWLVLAGRGRREKQMAGGATKMLYGDEQPDAVRQVMDVRLATEENGVRLFRGELREAPETAYAHLKSAFSADTVPLLQEDERLGAAIVLMPRPVEEARLERPVRPWLHWTLFALTVATTTWAGAAHQGVNLLREPERFAVGLPYSLGLLAILGVHELGHYFTALRHGIRVTPPYFIPLPFALGTFGAFIQMRSPTENRRALFDVAVAGPLAGLVIAIPALLIGLQSSGVVSGMALHADDGTPVRFIGGTSVGSSLLFALLAKLALPEALNYGCVVQLSPLAFAGWLGLFITGLNLIPIGQLDGGHMTRAMFGTRTGMGIGRVAMWSLILLALFVWPGLMTWAIIIFFLAGNPMPPLDDMTPISSGRMWLGYATFAILALIVVPVPRALLSAAGIHCPYL